MMKPYANREPAAATRDRTGQRLHQSQQGRTSRFLKSVVHATPWGDIADQTITQNLPPEERIHLCLLVAVVQGADDFQRGRIRVQDVIHGDLQALRAAGDADGGVYNGETVVHRVHAQVGGLAFASGREYLRLHRAQYPQVQKAFLVGGGKEDFAQQVFVVPGFIQHRVEYTSAVARVSARHARRSHHESCFVVSQHVVTRFALRLRAAGQVACGCHHALRRARFGNGHLGIAQFADFMAESGAEGEEDDTSGQAKGDSLVR